MGWSARICKTAVLVGLYALSSHAFCANAQPYAPEFCYAFAHPGTNGICGSVGSSEPCWSQADAEKAMRDWAASTSGPNSGGNPLAKYSPDLEHRQDHDSFDSNGLSLAYYHHRITDIFVPASSGVCTCPTCTLWHNCAAQNHEHLSSPTAPPVNLNAIVGWHTSPSEPGACPNTQRRADNPMFTLERGPQSLCPADAPLVAGKCTPASAPIQRRNLGKQCPANANGSDPINTVTGNHYYSDVDYIGTARDTLRFERHYNSQQAFANGTLGLKWTHTYHRILAITTAGATFKSANLTRPDGHVETFNASGGTNNFVADANVKARFVVNGTGWKYTDTDDTVELYDASKRLASITRRDGIGVTLTYDTVDTRKLVTVIDTYGRALSFFYDSDSRISSVTAPGNVAFLYRYDNKNNLSKVTYPDSDANPANNPIKTYLYTGTNYPNALTGVTDENSADFASWGYDAATGRATYSQNAGGAANRVDLTYSANGTFTSITDSRARQRTFNTFADLGIGYISAVTGGECNSCGGSSASTTYTTDGLKDHVTDADGNVTDYDYDAAGRGLVIKKTEGGVGEQRTTKTTWNATRRLPDIITLENGGGSGSEVQRTSFTYLNGQIKTKADHDSLIVSSDRITTYVYYGENVNDNPAFTGLLKSIDGPRTDVTDVTSYAYDPTARNLASVTNAAGQVTQFSNWDARGMPRTIIDPNGTTMAITYDPLGRETSRTIDGQTMQFAYDKAGLLKRITDPTGAYLNYTFDNAHRLTDIVDNLGNNIHYTLDSLGNRTKEEVKDSSNVLRRQIDRAYNDLNFMTSLTRSITGPAVGATTTFTYDAHGNQKRSIDARDPAPASPTIFSENFYDSLNRVRQIKDNLNGYITTTYDVHDRPASVTDPRGLVTNYALNGFGETTLQQSPDSGTTTSQYDAAGNMVSRLAAGASVATTYDYDALRRLTAIHYPGSLTVAASVVTFTYDENASGQNGVGRLTTVADESGVWTYRYDLKGTVKHVGVNFGKIGGGTFSLDYDYDAADRLQRITYPSGRHVTFVRSGGLITSATTDTGGAPTNLGTSVTHAPFGPMTSFKYGDAGLTPFTRDLDTDYRVRRTTHGTMLDLQYSYVDPITSRMTQNITEITDLLSATKTQKFTFDLLDRVLSGSSTAYGTQTYATVPDPYDLVGNRTKTVTGASTQVYNYVAGTNRLLNVTSGGPTYSYDLAGDATSRGQLKFTYGDDQRLKQVSDYDLPVAPDYTYNHNYLGQRVRKKVGAQSLFFMYGLDGELLAEIDGATGTISKEYGYLEGTPIALFTPDNPLDTDGDGLPNAWETQFGLNPNNASDASSNSDGDKLTALQEYQMGTDPTKGDTDGDGLQDDADPQPTEINSAWQIPIQRELLQ